jgi:beta-glucosidase/6-phospho-beta-glucosidase/beta-galactosidase
VNVLGAHENFDAAGELTDEKRAAFLARHLEALKAWALRFKWS